MTKIDLSKIELRPLRPTDEAVFFDSLKLWQGEDLSWYSFIYANNPKVTFAEMLKRLEADAKGEDLPQGWVPASMLYAFYDGQIIGRYHIRQSLNEHLMRRGGHVGYAVAKDFRQQGVAAQMMLLGVQYIRQSLPHLDRILVTCADSNVGSYRVIEGAGGVLENKVYDSEHGEDIRRYWITIF